jgi:hypothetical protein
VCVCVCVWQLSTAMPELAQVIGRTGGGATFNAEAKLQAPLSPAELYGQDDS